MISLSLFALAGLCFATGNPILGAALSLAGAACTLVGRTHGQADEDEAI